MSEENEILPKGQKNVSEFVISIMNVKNADFPCSVYFLNI